MSQNNKISIISPFFNEEAGVDNFYREILRVIIELPKYDFEILCIDDGSKDNTLENLLRIHYSDNRFKIIQLSRNFGKEAALTAGIQAASGDAVIPIDSDLQDPPNLIIKMIDQWENGADVVLAKRVDRNSDSFFKRKTAELFYKYNNAVSSIQIPENVGDFRLMDKSVVEALNKLPEKQRFMKGLFAWVGFNAVTIDYARCPRGSGHTKFSGWKLWNFAIEGITSFSTVPLRLWTYIGIIGALLSLIYALFIATRTIILGVELPGYASLLVVILFLGSIQLVGLGILGEYIGRMFMETKNRPIYIVKKYYGIKL